MLGVDCFVGDLRAAAEAVVERSRSGRGGYACLGNAHVLVTAQHDAQLRRALDEAWVVFPDGAPVAWLQRRLGDHGAQRVGGPDLMPLVIASGVPAGVRHFLLGSTADVLTRLQWNLEHAYPGSRIVGAYSPSRRDVDAAEPQIVEHIRARSPDIVWCAFGAPRQELWMSRHVREITPATLVGVGAAFDFIAGTKPRAPAWMQRGGLEWLHRFGAEPRRLGSRYLRTNTEFVLRAAGEVGARRSDSSHPSVDTG
ncbi:MAG TPA: WecB/TagA/CpsF family glycosyltransferase [Gaiellaceae bacterium]|nr:WecB/TagA/CpsF family glycosyltransferase [Gaiellaceae bacterium]